MRIRYELQRNPLNLLDRLKKASPRTAAEEKGLLNSLRGLDKTEFRPLVVVVGGFLDGLMQHAYGIVGQWPSSSSQTCHVFYRQHHEGLAVLNLVNMYAMQGQPVLLIGHSWGADAVVNAVAKRTDAAICFVATLDPVSRKGPPNDRLPHVGQWINAYVDYRVTPLWKRSTIIARIGGPWEQVSVADENIVCPCLHHEAIKLFAGRVQDACLARLASF